MAMIDKTISVIIPCHNYAPYLGDCLQSVIGQSHQPLEIIVVDDDSNDEPEKVIEKFKSANIKLIRVSHRNVVKSQKEGLLVAKGEYITCIDADDTIDPFYIERGLAKFDSDYRIGIVYSDFEYSGLMQGISSFPNSSLEYDIHRMNYIHTGSIFKKDIAALTDAFEFPKKSVYVYDWIIWKKILRNGYLAVKQEALYRYKRHENSHSIKTYWNAKPLSYAEGAALDQEKVTVVIIVSDENVWQAQVEFLKKLDWEHSLIRLQIIHQIDSFHSNENDFKKLRNEVIGLPFYDIQYLPFLYDKLASKKEKEFEILRVVAEEADTPYLLYVDENVIPESRVIKELFKGFCENTVGVSSDFSTKSWDDFYVKKRQGRRLRETTGIHITRKNLFSCMLFRSKYLKEVFMQDRDLLLSKYNTPEEAFYMKIPKDLVMKTNCDLLSAYIVDEKEVILETQHIENNFDEEFYLSEHPDVKNAIDEGAYSSGLEHFIKHGKNENREYQIKKNSFDEVYYLKSNPDVQIAVKEGKFTSGLDHYLQYGEKEGRHAFFG